MLDKRFWNMTHMTIRRKLDAGERFFWLLDRVSGMNFVVFAELACRLDVAQVNAVLQEAQQAHPLLCVKIVHKGEDELWFESADLPLTTHIRTVNQENWQSAIEQEMSHVFALDEAPLLRCLLLEFGDAERSVLALTFQHAIADGRSGTTLLREILGRLFNPAQAVFAKPAAHPPMHTVFPEKYHWHKQPEAAIQLGEIRKAELKRHGRPVTLPWLDQLAPQRLPRFERIELATEETARLLKHCKQQGATLHGVLGAAQLLAKFKSIAADTPLTFSLGSPADMRPYLEGEIPTTSLGLYVSLLFSTYQVSIGQDFWELARSVGSDIKRQLARGDGHLLFAQVKPDAFPPTDEGIAAFGKMMLASPQSSMISNIGVVEPVPGADQVESISFVLCPMPYQLMFSAVSTFKGRLIINLAYDAGKLGADKAQQFTNWIRQALLEAAARG